MYKDLLGIKFNDIVSIIGAGGKTTLMLNLAEELRKYKTLITTTTKIFLPNRNCYDYLYIGCKPSIKENETGIYVYGNSIEQNKIIGTSADIYKQFDFVIIESDGASKKHLKGWNENEPVVLEETTKTIGILSLKMLGRRINDEHIHRTQCYTKITGAQIGEKVNAGQLIKLILHKNGLFKNALGKKILVINFYEEDRDGALEEILQKSKSVVDTIIVHNCKRGVAFEA